MDELERLRVLFESVLRIGSTARTAVVENTAGLVRLSPVVLAGLTAAAVVHRRRR